MKILVINGPNLNLLGIREKNVYGAKTLDDVCNEIKEAFQHKKDVYIDFYQSNIEGEIVSKIGDSRSEEHTSELQSRQYLVCRLLLEKKKKKENTITNQRIHDK